MGEVLCPDNIATALFLTGPEDITQRDPEAWRCVVLLLSVSSVMRPPDVASLGGGHGVITAQAERRSNDTGHSDTASGTPFRLKSNHHADRVGLSLIKAIRCEALQRGVCKKSDTPIHKKRPSLVFLSGHKPDTYFSQIISKSGKIGTRGRIH